MRFGIRVILVQLLITLVAVTAQAQTCTIDFETCPAEAQGVEVCGATFSGGSCVAINPNGPMPNCAVMGMRVWSSSTTRTVITIPTGTLDIEVFFAHTGDSTLTRVMTFWDAVSGGNEVGTPMITNGACDGDSILPLQSRTFSRPVHRIEIEASGDGSVTGWIDAMTLTDAEVAVRRQTWGLIKRLYRD